MGKSYMKMIESVMKQYEAVWKKASEEWERFGEVSSTTDTMLERLESKLALLEMTF